MNHSLLKPLLISALAASMLVGCTEIPTVNNQNQNQSPGSEQAAITAASVKEMLSEVKQALASMRSLNGASQTFSAIASGYRLSGYTVAQTGSPWDWTTKTLQDGTVESTRHVIEKDASGLVITDIESTRRVKYVDGKKTYTQTDIVTRSPFMLPGTYTIEGAASMSGQMGEPDFKQESEQTTRFTPPDGMPTVATLKMSATSDTQSYQASGTLPDGSRVTYESTVAGAWSMAPRNEVGQTISLAITSPSGKTFKVANDIDTIMTRSDNVTSIEQKGWYEVALGTIMKVRFAIDVLSEQKQIAHDDWGYTYEHSFPRNSLTAELLDGAGKLIAPIVLETTTDHSKPPTTGTLTLEGEEPSELDMSFMMDIAKVHESVSRPNF